MKNSRLFAALGCLLLLLVGVVLADPIGFQVDVDPQATTGTGIKVDSNAAGSGVDVSAISTGTNEALTINAKGSGTITLADTSTGGITLTTATTVSGTLAANGNVTVGASASLTLANVGTIAAAGDAQANATAITNQITYVTAADGAKGVRLPAATAGAVYVVYSTVATNGLLVYPATGDDINDGTGDAAVTMEGKTMAIFVGLDTATWAAMFTADS